MTKITFTNHIREKWMYNALLYGKDAADAIAAEEREQHMPKSEKTNEKMVPVLYCDIDGTIRWGKDELGRFVNTVEDVRVFDGVADLLWGYKKLGWRIIGVSNQGGIALGHMTTADCVKAMAETQVQTNFAFDKLVWCSHHPDAKDPEMAVCWCRKPKAGLVIEAALALAEKTRELYPPHLGLFVGDRFEDNECAKNAGLQFMNARDWRLGEHLERLKKGESLPKPRELSATMDDEAMPGPDRAFAEMVVSRANPGAERLSDEALQRSLEMTGVKTKTIPVSELEDGAEFVYEGVLYTVAEKGELMLYGLVEGQTKMRAFYDPAFLEERQMTSDSVPWTTEVITDDNMAVKTKTVQVSELEVGENFVHEELLYSVIQKSEVLITTMEVGGVTTQPNATDLRLLTFYSPGLLTEFQMSPGSLPWTTEVITDDK